jgi:hypothetical protein
MPIPLNSIAETIQRMEEENLMFERQISSMQNQINSNSDAIIAMADLAEWGEDPEIPGNLPPMEYPPQNQ